MKNSLRISGGKRCNLVQTNALGGDWWEGEGKCEGCTMEGPTNHWYWLALRILGIVDESEVPYSEEKELPINIEELRRLGKKLKE